MPDGGLSIGLFLGSIGAFVTGGGLVAGGIGAMMLGGAIVGAAVGGITAAITGGSILKGMAFGALGGLAVGGAAFALAPASVGGGSLLGGGLAGGGSGSGLLGAAHLGGGGALGAAGGGGSTLAGGGMWAGAGTAVVSGASKMLGSLGEEAPVDYSLEKIAAEERMNHENAEAQKEIAAIQASASGGGGGDGTDQMALAAQQAEAQAKQNALDRELSREKLAGELASAEGDRATAIKKAAMEIQSAKDLRNMETEEQSKARGRAIVGARSGKVRGGVHGSQSTKTMSDIRDEYVSQFENQDKPDPATIVPVNYVEEQQPTI